MITTATEMYALLLELYQRQKTGSITIDEFNTRVNVAALNVVTSKLPVAESSQYLDDSLRTLTRERILTPNSATGVPVIIDTQIESNNYNTLLPYYLRMLSVEFKIKYKGSSCNEEDSISDWITAKRYRLDNTKINNDPFQKPSDSKPYYRLSSNDAGTTVSFENWIVPIINTPSLINQIKLNYVKYPNKIILTANPATDSNSDLPSEIQQEIVFLMLREILENTESPRVYKPAESGSN
jgi:hypothetical protein